MAERERQRLTGTVYGSARVKVREAKCGNESAGRELGGSIGGVELEVKINLTSRRDKSWRHGPVTLDHRRHAREDFVREIQCRSGKRKGCVRDRGVVRHIQ